MSNTVRVEPGLAVRSWGETGRPTVLLVHGYPDTHAVWEGVAAELADEYHVVAYDVRGAGDSIRPRGRDAYRLDRLMDDLRAVLDTVAPDGPVHLVGHDWGSVQAWEAVCTMPERFASFTSLSGPCLDHVGHWMRGSDGTAPSAQRLKQGLHSWYIAAFQTPVLPELAWRSGVAGTLLGRLERTRFAPTVGRDGAHGVWLYRANMPDRLRRPRERRTDVPTQIVVPTRDRFVTAPLAEAARPFVSRLWVRPIRGRHWVPARRPELVARVVREHIEQVSGAEPVRELRRAAPGRDAGFAGRLVLVTGAGSGIGRATALAFAELGAEVVAADIDTAAVERTAELAALVGGPSARAYTVDVSDGPAMERFAADVDARHGVPDIVVNNAGIGMVGSFLDHDPGDWDELLGVNLWGVIHGSRLFGRRMVDRGEGGHIVNTASAAAFTPNRSLSAYAASKSAVVMLSECLRAELASDGIGVTVVCPGVINTGVTRTTRFVGQTPRVEARRRKKMARAYSRRNYTPERVAAQIVRAVRADRPLAPITPEARAAYWLSRLSPSAARAVGRL